MSGVVHTLKTEATCWKAIESGEKRFEARRDDRFFQRGDVVELVRLCPITNTMTTKRLKFTIGWMLRGERFGIKEGFVVFQLEPLIEGDHP